MAFKIGVTVGKRLPIQFKSNFTEMDTPRCYYFFHTYFQVGEEEIYFNTGTHVIEDLDRLEKSLQLMRSNINAAGDRVHAMSGRQTILSSDEGWSPKIESMDKSELLKVLTIVMDLVEKARLTGEFLGFMNTWD